MSNTTQTPASQTPAAPAGAWEPMAAPFNLEKGVLYACSIGLSAFEKLATVQMISNKLSAAGFVEVSVTPDKKRAEGRWGQADVSGAPLPSQVKQVWRWRDAATATPPSIPSAPATATGDVEDEDAEP